MSRRAVLYVLLAVAATARLWLQLAALPPYAGLDELYHVARVAFVANEQRQPTTSEPSVPRYLDQSIDQKWDALPSLMNIGDRWPEAVRSSRGNIVQPRPLSPDRVKPYGRANYEAQQPSPYYALVAPLRAVAATDVGELRAFRILALLLALVIVMCTAFIGERWFGTSGIVAAALVVSLPTWLALVLRAGNDAPACAFAALGIAITIAAPQRVRGWLAEAAAWAIAISLKLTVWPVAIIVPLAWWKQRASRPRIIIVIALCAIAAALTLADLHARAHNPLGVVAFDRPGSAPLDAHIDLRELVTVTIASAAFTGAQFSEAMRPLGIALYLGPVIIAIAWATLRKRSADRWPLQLAAIALVTYGAAQLFNVISCVMARRAGNDIPIGGKEGWYWFALMPVVVAALVPPALTRLGKARFALVAWIIGWDVLINECRLFHDFAGNGSPALGEALFRWGPLRAPFTADLSTIGVGPLANHTTALRLVHLMALVALVVMESRSQGSSTDVA